jgi:hypothetical protein
VFVWVGAEIFSVGRLRYDNYNYLVTPILSFLQKAHEMLRKAWDAEGSPFKGTPFDPSRVQISGDF